MASPTFYNNLSFFIMQEIGPQDTVLKVLDTQGIPTPTNGDYIIGTLVASGGEGPTEIIHITAVDSTANTLTVLRAQEGTPARSFLYGPDLSCRITAEPLNTLYTNTGELSKPDGATKVGYQVPATGSIVQTVATKLNGTLVTPQDFGAVNTGLVSAVAALTAAFTAYNEVYFPAGVYLIDSNYTIPNGKVLYMNSGAQLSVSSGVTLTIKGRVEAGFNQVFTGAGVVLGIKDVVPEWFGAKKDGVNDDASSLQKAINCIQASVGSDGAVTSCALSAGTYYLGSTVTITPRRDGQIQVVGAGGDGGTSLIAFSTFTGSTVLQIAGAAGINDSVSSFLLKGFRILPQTSGSGPSTGITVGGTATTLQGGPHESSVIEDVATYEFMNGFLVQNVRLYCFKRCGSWNNTLSLLNGIILQAIAANEFTGDLDFYSCQFVTGGAGTFAAVLKTATTGDMKGIRFHACIFYKGAISIQANNTARLGDIWFDSGWQYDVPPADGIVISANGAGSGVYDINFFDGYWAGGQAGAYKALNVFTLNSGWVKSIKVCNMRFSQGTGHCLFFNGTIYDVLVDGNSFLDQNSGTCVVIGSGVLNSVVTNNILQRLNSTTDICDSVVGTLAGADYYTIRNNSSGGYATTSVTDGAAGAHKTVDGNI